MYTKNPEQMCAHPLRASCVVKFLGFESYQQVTSKLIQINKIARKNTTNVPPGLLYKSARLSTCPNLGRGTASSLLNGLM